MDEKLKLEGTTDTLLLHNAAQAMQSLDDAQVTQLAREDMDSARALLLLPSERIRRGLKEGTKERQWIQDALGQSFLEEDYAKMKSANDQFDAINIFGQSFVQIGAEIHRTKERIQSGKAQESPMLVYNAQYTEEGELLDLETGELIADTEDRKGIVLIHADIDNCHYRDRVRKVALSNGHNPDDWTDEKMNEFW